jgi:hypothetical protein
MHSSSLSGLMTFEIHENREIEEFVRISMHGWADYLHARHDLL